MLWFTSDTHFQHSNIVKYCNRPFKDVDEMDNAIIKNWNSRVRPKDWVYHLGDLAFNFKHNTDRVIEIVNSLNGKITWIYGNHDKYVKKLLPKFKNIIEACDYKELKFNKEFIVMSHYPFERWNKSHHGSFNLFGHVHGTMPFDHKIKRVDVGVDSWDFKPVSFRSIQLKFYDEGE